MSNWLVHNLYYHVQIHHNSSSVMYILMWQENLTDSNHSGAEALANVLASWNFSKVEIPGDRNCLFTAVALYLETVYPSLPSSHPLTDIINSLGVTMGTSSTTYSIIDALRKAVVQEWLGQNSQYYTGFLSSVQLEHEVDHAPKGKFGCF